MTTADKIRRFLAKGLTAVEIAKKLGISKAQVHTVRWKDKQKAKASKDKFLDKMDRLATKPVQFEAKAKPSKIEKAATLTDDELIALFDRPKTDLVNHPAHYTAGGIETIDFIEAKDLNYRLGNAVKYIARAGKKDTDPVQDLEKAAWYLKREIEARKGA